MNEDNLNLDKFILIHISLIILVSLYILFNWVNLRFNESNIPFASLNYLSKIILSKKACLYSSNLFV